MSVDEMTIDPSPALVTPAMPTVPCEPPLATSTALLEWISIEPLSLTAPMPTLSGIAPDLVLPLPTTVMELPAPVSMVTLPVGEPPETSASMPPLLSPVTLIWSLAPMVMSVAPAPVLLTRMPPRPPALVDGVPPPALTVVSTLSANFTFTPPVEETSTPA